MEVQNDNEPIARSKWGSVKPFAGKWRAKKKGGAYVGLFETEAKAWAVLEVYRRKQEGTGPLTLRTFGGPTPADEPDSETWFDLREKGGQVASVERERSVWTTHVLTADFVDWPLEKVGPVAIQVWLGQLVRKVCLSAITCGPAGARVTTLRPARDGRTLSRQVLVHARKLLKAMFDQAIMESDKTHVTSNPVDLVQVPKMARVTEDEDEWGFLEQKEIDRLLALLKKEGRLKLRAFYAVAIYGGLRDAELLGLEWPDITFKGAESTIKVRRERCNKPLKSKTSRRTIPLLPVAREALRDLQHMGGVTRATGVIFGPEDGGWYSAGYDGGWPDKAYATQENELKSDPGWRSKAGIRDHLRMHDLRHTCASHLVMGTWGRAYTQLEVRDWLGHSDLKTTERYMHLAPGALVNTAAEAEREAERRKRAGKNLGN